MNFIKNKLSYILIFLGILVLACYFPLTSEDIWWHNLSWQELGGAIQNNGTGIIPSLLLFVITKIKLLKVLFVSIISTSLMLSCKNIINKRNSALVFLGFFVFLLADKTVFAHFFVSSVGFAEHVLGSLFLMIFIKMFVSNSFMRINSELLFLLGLVGCLLSPVYSFVIFGISLIYMLIFKEKNLKGNYLKLFIGEVVGISITVFMTDLFYKGFSSILIHDFMNSIKGVNFLCVLIFSAIILFEGIKVFCNGKRIQALFSIVGVSSLLFVSLLSKNDILMYISYIIYFIGSFYILFNSRVNKLFKYKVTICYLFKLIFILVLCIIGNIESGSILFLYLINILFIMDAYDLILPKKFLKNTWTIIVLGLLGVNIYIYKNVSTKYEEMNRFIKNALECYTEDVAIPGKYKTEYLYKQLPKTEEDFMQYISFYNVDLYDKNKVRGLKFNR